MMPHAIDPILNFTLATNLAPGIVRTLSALSHRASAFGPIHW